jgi:putative transposase
MVNHHKLSERHTCALVGLSRDTYRHESQTSALNVQLRDQIIQTAHTRRR